MSKEQTVRVSYRMPKPYFDRIASTAQRDRRTKTQVLLLALDSYFGVSTEAKPAADRASKVLTSGRRQVPLRQVEHPASPAGRQSGA
jgi:hypothetical protein